MNKKGMVLFIVMSILFMVVLLANIVLNLISSQSSLTSHQVKRVQAYYAAQAGVNYALEKLRLNNDTYNGTNCGGCSQTFRICSSDYEAINTTTHDICSGTGNITETSFPASIRYVDMFIDQLNLIDNNRTVNVTVNYTSAY